MLDGQVQAYLPLSALGVYFHALFVSITLGFPVAIAMLLWKYHKSGESLYLDAAKVMTSVLVVNFALGAVMGTLVEFGLVQIWPGTIFAIATFAFAPLALELIAFIMEIAFLILFYVTLGKIRPTASIGVLALYAAFAYFSGVLITAVNSWMQAPWGTGPVAKALYPFLPEYGPLAADVQKLVAVKALALVGAAQGVPASVVLQMPGISEKIGEVLLDPFVAMASPYALASIFHNITAAIIIGLAIGAAGWAYKYWKTRDEKYLKVLKAVLPPLVVLMLIQPTVFGHFMGEMVVEYNPTKFALMEGAATTYYNPVVALVAYGDPNKPIVGFDQFYKQCDQLGDTTVGDLLKKVGVDLNAVVQSLGLSGQLKLSQAASLLDVKLADVCKADLQKAEAKMELVHYAYYTKIAGGVVAFVAALVLLFAAWIRVPGLTPLAEKIMSIFGPRERALFVLTLLVLIGSVLAAALGWAVREVGRKPWTVYGLLYPEEVVTPVPATAGFLAFAYLVILAVGIGGLVAMYIVASRRLLVRK